MAQHTGSLWHDVVKAVIALMRARPGYRDPNVIGADAAHTPVFHSLEVALTEDHPDTEDQPDTFLVIGWMGNPDQPAESGELGQTWAALGTRSRDEQASVRCAVVVQTGDLSVPGAVPALWDAAFAVIDDVDAVLRPDPTLGLTSKITLAQVGSLTSIRTDPGRGGEVTIEFLITYKSRI